MTKEDYIVLIQKDVKELGIVAQVLSEVKQLSPALMSLAHSKITDVMDNIDELAKISAIEIDKAESEPETQLIAEKIELLVDAINAEQEMHTTSPVAEKTEESNDNNTQEETVTEEMPEEEETDKNEEIIEECEHAESDKNESGEEEEQKEEQTTVVEKEELPVQSAINIASLIKVGRFNSFLHSKIDSLTRGISMGDRFRFQRELFNNDAALRDRTIEALDNCQSLAEAEKYLSEHFEWKWDSEIVVEFLTLVYRRFK
ncbi:MAG: hypothetical protein LBR81_06590 [Prevotellaceae bacterium]|nr:hypothetical protein [Prevotellaceae bacterium]